MNWYIWLLLGFMWLLILVIICLARHITRVNNQIHMLEQILNDVAEGKCKIQKLEEGEEKK